MDELQLIRSFRSKEAATNPVARAAARDHLVAHIAATTSVTARGQAAKATVTQPALLATTARAEPRSHGGAPRWDEHSLGPSRSSDSDGLHIGDFALIGSTVRDLLAMANALVDDPLSLDTLTLLMRATSVLAYYIEQKDPMTSVEALRQRIAPAANEQPAPWEVPRRPIDNDTVQDLFSNAVADVVDLGIRMACAHGDRSRTQTVFSTFVLAGRDSHAVAVGNQVLPLIGIGMEAFDSFVVHNISELVFGTRHDPSAVLRDSEEIDFVKVFDMLIARDAHQRTLLRRVVSEEEIARAVPRDVVVQRLPHGPYMPRLRLPAGEIMAREHPAMVEVLERHGYRGVLAYGETDLKDPAGLNGEMGRASNLTNVHVRAVGPQELTSFQAERSITVDTWNVNHYIVKGVDRAGITRRRVARLHRFDRRLTVFDTVGFDDDVMHEAVVLAEYATANQLRKSCIDASLNDRIKPGLLEATRPGVRAGMRRLAMLSNAAIIAITRRQQAMDYAPASEAGLSE